MEMEFRIFTCKSTFLNVNILLHSSSIFFNLFFSPHFWLYPWKNERTVNRFNVNCELKPDNMIDFQHCICQKCMKLIGWLVKKRVRNQVIIVLRAICFSFSVVLEIKPFKRNTFLWKSQNQTNKVCLLSSLYLDIQMKEETRSVSLSLPINYWVLFFVCVMLKLPSYIFSD